MLVLIIATLQTTELPGVGV